MIQKILNILKRFGASDTASVESKNKRQSEEQESQPNFLIVGLGNPGRKYELTRHNIGFQVVDKIASEMSLSWNKHLTEYHYFIAEFDGNSALVCKPMTYMNLSGQAVEAISRKYSIETDSILVIVDDIDLPLGARRLRKSGSDGGHRGLRSIQEEIGSQQFARLRLGVGQPPENVEPADFVLQPFAQSDDQIVKEMVAKAAESAIFAVGNQFEKTIAKYNYNPAPSDLI